MYSKLLLRVSLFFLYAILNGCSNNQSNNEESVQDYYDLSSLPKDAQKYFQESPKNMIPYQIGETQFFYEFLLKNISSENVKDAFSYSNDKYTVEEYKDGMIVRVKGILINPYSKEMWVPIPDGLTLSSNEYHWEDEMRVHNHPYQEYFAVESKTINKLHYKFDSLDGRLYHFAPNDSIELYYQFGPIPIPKTFMIYGFTVSIGSSRYEKALVLNSESSSLAPSIYFKD
jgi:hypothetical protein